MNDPGGFFEQATFCKEGDAKRPGLVAAGLSFENIQICDDDLSRPAGSVDEDGTFTPAITEDLQPTFWYMRVMFDELLNPDIEELIEILDPTTNEGTGIFNGSLVNTQPVLLNCNGTAVEYDGYYSPSGNNITWPLGPSLVIQPVDPSTVPSGSSCTLEIKDIVVDKGGEPVPADQRGPFMFGISPLQFVGSSPEPSEPGEEAEIVTDSAVVLSFNGFIDPASIAGGTTGEVILKEGAVGDVDCANVTATGTVVNAGVAENADGDPVSVDITKVGGFTADRMYSLTFTDTNEVQDVAGGVGTLPGADDFTLCFLATAPI
ncbi:MAG: hypothetical protein H0V17_15420 [Deltaproteobacteria bacterium]|nr:hypothetical protein [Deltaproteobacteria bacterium]